MGVLIITEAEIIPYQLMPLLPQHSQGEHGKTSGESALLIAEIGVLLILPHGEPGVPLHQGVEAGVLHGTGKELVYSLFGQSCDGKITLFRPFELHRIAAGKILLFQKLTQVVPLLQNILEDSDVLKERVPYEALVTTEFAEKATAR